MKNNSNDFYTGYENDSQEFASDDTEQKMAFAITKAPIKQMKKELIFTVLLTFPFAICLSFVFKVFAVMPPFSPIVAAIQETIFSVIYPLSFILGIIVSYKAVQKIGSIDDGKKRTMINKHVLILLSCSVLCMITSMSETNYVFVITFLLSIAVIVYSFKIDTPFEKKLFIPIMIITVICSTITKLPAVAEQLMPEYTVSLDADYVFVSPKEISPKKQSAQYYYQNFSSDILNRAFTGGGMLESYEDLQNDIINYDDTSLMHNFYFDTELTETLKDVVQTFGSDYDEAFFENNYLLILPLQYPSSPTEIKIANVLVKGQKMTITQNICYQTLPQGDDFTEFCLVFIRIPQALHIDKNYSVQFKEQFLQE